MPNKKRLKIILTAVAAICIGAFGIVSAMPEKTVGAIETRTLGNSPANIANGGMVVQDGTDVYYSNNGIYVKPMDGTAREVTQLRAQGLCTDGEWLYFSNLSDNNRCYRIRKDGTEAQQLTDFSVEYLNLIGDRLYFACTRELERCGIYVMKPDGSGMEKISGVFVSSLLAYGGRLYYTDKDADGKLFSVSEDGQDQKQLTKGQAYCPIFVPEEGQIYYSSQDGIFRINPDGSAKKQISRVPANRLATDEEGNLYYGYFDYSGKGETGIYRCGPEGENPQRIRGDETIYLAVANGELYFKSMTQGMAVMRCALDGTNGMYIAGGQANSIAGE